MIACQVCTRNPALTQRKTVWTCKDCLPRKMRPVVTMEQRGCPETLKHARAS